MWPIAAANNDLSGWFLKILWSNFSVKMFWWKCSGVTQYHQQIMACLVWLVSENLAAPRQQRHPFTHSCYLKPCQDPKAKGQSYKTGHAHIKYLILDTQWQIWGNTSLRYTHYTCMQYKPKKIFVNNVFLFNAHVQYKLQKFLAKPVFFAGLVFWFTAHVQYKHQKIYFAIIVPASTRCSIDKWRRHGLTRKASANF